ncbi:MAG: class I SAM-dependent methyltransferase [Blastocatellia bacterium]|nr:class I SAM-dependent methyltransferase [Blastocatellia bacterium]
MALFDDLYFTKIAAAYVRGSLAETQTGPLFETPLEELAEEDFTALIELGLAAGLRLHRFKRTMGLVRVQRVLGTLRGLYPQNLLDVGTGRGAFLWPLLDAFPALEVTCVDLDEKRVRDIRAVRNGGFDNLQAEQFDVTELPFADDSFEVVTMLEVLEHLPEPQKALERLVSIAQDFVILSVPSHEDDNPEHIHLFNEKTLTEFLQQAGAVRVQTEYVLNHILVVARV